MGSISLSRQDTSILKGVAICAMLFHHLYCYPPECVEQYTGFLFYLGVLGKVCVSIFLFCSGYGLTSQFSIQEDRSPKGNLKFVVRRLLKFYTNYWVVLFIFVPISIFVFGRTFEVAYAGLNIPKRIVFELLAINSFSSYNITWWFNALIVILYLLFPAMYWFEEKLGLVFVAMSLILFQFCGHIPGNYAEVYFWQFPFVIGMYCSLRMTKCSSLATFFEKRRVLCIVLLLVMLSVLVLLRLELIIPGWGGVRIDPFITCVIVILVVLMSENDSWLSPLFGFLGKHAMNVYLIHTFFNGYWHPQWLHTGVMRCGLNFVVLLSICLVISLFLEWMKERFGIYSAMNRLTERMQSLI